MVIKGRFGNTVLTMLRGCTSTSSPRPASSVLVNFPVDRKRVHAAQAQQIVVVGLIFWRGVTFVHKDTLLWAPLMKRFPSTQKPMAVCNLDYLFPDTQYISLKEKPRKV